MECTWRLHKFTHISISFASKPLGAKLGEDTRLRPLSLPIDRYYRLRTRDWKHLTSEICISHIVTHAGTIHVAMKTLVTH